MSDPPRLNRFRRSPWMPLLALLLVGLLVGAWLVNDYGMSWDEERNYTVGFDALQSYVNPQRYQDYLAHGDPLSHHGPSYFMAFAMIARGAVVFNPAWHIADGRHLANYLTFLVGIAAFYYLALRLTSKRTAWMAAALFATQPLLFGHAFINQKDTPFMAFFLLSVAIGMHAVDQTAARDRGRKDPAKVTGWNALREQWRRLGPFRRILVASYIGAGLFLLIDLATPAWRQVWVAGLAHALEEGESWEPLPRLAGRLVGSQTAAMPEAYLAASVWLHDLGRILIVLAWVALGVVIALRIVPRAEGPDKRYGSSLGWAVLAGSVLGVTVSMRQVGAFAGLLIMLYWLRRGRSALWLIGVYALAAAVATYVTWPYLWAAPFHRFGESLATGADFEIHMTPYRGQWIFSDQLPWHYFPTLAGLELTLPAIVLFLVGAGVAVWRWRHRTIDRAGLEIVLLWMIVPLLGLIGFGIGAYNNIRQLHFVLVPVLLVAGVGWDGLVKAIRRKWVEGLLLAGILLPGIVGIIRLHPYEYTYFNSLTGGTVGAEGRFALDYWCTSYREAMAYVNEVAAPGATVMAMGPLRPAMAFARSDLEVLRNEGDRPIGSVSYLITCYRWIEEEWGEGAGMERIHTVGRDSAVFAEVFHRKLTETGAGE